ncbi:MAG: hypothetical protein IPM97_08535 [Bdellovibrionaceae bacterium]|nr:hypothetical protein [Pseudobdellovibrionaceae bacterium]
MNTIKNMIVIVILSLGLSACGGGSGGSSTSLPSDGGTNPGGGNGGGGSTGGGNGTASYYGFNSANSIVSIITEYTELQSGAGYVDKTTETNTGVCNNGEFYSSVSQWVVFQNGRSILLKESSASASVVNLDASSSPSNSAFGFSSPHTTAKGFASTTRGSHYTIHGNFSRIYDNQTATVPMMGISATLSGKNISIHNAVHRTCGSGDVYSHNGQSVCDTVGSGAVSFYFEQ